MKTKTISFIAVFLFMGGGLMMAQKSFNIKIESHKDRVRLSCSEGCAWSQLEFDLKSKTQAVDEYGMTTVKSASSIKSDDLADFLFTLQRKSGKISLKGVEGTAWTVLEQDCPLENCSFSLHQGGKK